MFPDDPADLEDQTSEQLANPPAWIPWSGGDHPDDRDEQADYEPKDAGDEK